MKIFLLHLAVIVFFLPFTVSAITLSLNDVNQKVCDRFESDVSRMAAIMEEVRDRKGIKETRVAFGGVDTPIKSADYQITYVAEAIAFQRAQKYPSEAALKSSLEILKGKILQAKTQVRKVLDSNE